MAEPVEAELGDDSRAAALVGLLAGQAGAEERGRPKAPEAALGVAAALLVREDDAAAGRPDEELLAEQSGPPRARAGSASAAATC
jgi:hypothetical protein